MLGPVTMEEGEGPFEYKKGRRPLKNLDFHYFAGPAEAEEKEEEELQQENPPAERYTGFVSNAGAGTSTSICTSDANKFAEMLKGKSFSPYALEEVQGASLTASRLREEGLSEPLLIRSKKGLGLRVPDASTFGVRQVADTVGHDYRISVIEVSSQSELTPQWTLGQWVQYYEGRPPHAPPLNVLSLEFSDTPMRKLVMSPKVARELDWVERYWPPSRRLVENDYPKVGYYCLMSIAGSYTDFHVDFGGSSVWYHILRGAKTFLFVRPTPQNLAKYEEWVGSPSQESTFFGDVVDECYQVKLEAGNTLIIPSAWIHAVFTPVDSLVFGGNFVHSLSIPEQMAVHEMETRMHIQPKFRFPRFQELCFLTASSLLRGLRAEVPGSLRLSTCERRGLPELIRCCREWLASLRMPDGQGGAVMHVCPTGWAEASLAAGCIDVTSMVDELEEWSRKPPPTAAAPSTAAVSTSSAAAATEGEGAGGGIRLKFRLGDIKKVEEEREKEEAAAVAAPQLKIRVKLPCEPPTPLPKAGQQRMPAQFAKFMDGGDEEALEEEWRPEGEEPAAYGGLDDGASDVSDDEVTANGSFEGDEGGLGGSRSRNKKKRRKGGAPSPAAKAKSETEQKNEEESAPVTRVLNPLARIGGFKVAPKSKVDKSKLKAMKKNVKKPSGARAALLKKLK
jgi:hypothetical protein